MKVDQENKIKGIRLGVILNISLAIIFFIAGIYLVTEVKNESKQQALMEAETKARIILDRNLATHTYFSHSLKPAVFKLTEPILTKDYFEPSWMSSTYAVREIDKNFKKLLGENYSYKECAINARSPENEADEFERKFIEELNENPDLKYRSQIRKIDNDYYYVILQRGEVMEQACLRCHSTPDNAPKGLIEVYGPDRSFDRSANEVVSAISIRVPLSEAYATAEQLTKHLTKILLFTLFLLFVIQYFLYRFFVLEPISTLKNKTTAISENDELLGEEITLPPSFEFRGLVKSFNIMSRKLRQHIDSLEDKVTERTIELKKTNEALQQSLDEIKTLHGIIPICMYCKKIRNDKGVWDRLEEYMSNHLEADFSHGMCPECYKQQMEDLDKEN